MGWAGDVFNWGLYLGEFDKRRGARGGVGSLDNVENAKGEIDKAPHDEDRGEHEAQTAGAQPLYAEEGNQDDTAHTNHNPCNSRYSNEAQAPTRECTT